MLQDGLRLPPDIPRTLSVDHVFKLAPSAYPNGCHIAEVEIDPETGITEVVRYVMVNDFGTVVNPMLVEGQLHGGVMQGIGQALMERTLFDEEGQLMTGSYMDYQLPRAADAPPIFTFESRPQPTPTNPLGAKGCGEAGCAGSLPSVMNAVVDALLRPMASATSTCQRRRTCYGKPFVTHSLQRREATSRPQGAVRLAVANYHGTTAALSTGGPLRDLEPALYGRARQSSFEPCRHLRQAVEVDEFACTVEADEVAHPAKHRDVGDREFVAHDPRAAIEPSVQDAEETLHLRAKAFERALVFNLAAGEFVEEAKLSEHRPNEGHLEEDPLNRLVARNRIRRQELTGLLGKIEQDRSGFEEAHRPPARPIGIDDRGNLSVRIQR